MKYQYSSIIILVALFTFMGINPSPAAAASVIGYWDLHGYPNFFTAEGWANVSLTENVKDQIPSPAHNA